MKDFPILRRLNNGKRLVYLDNAATSQKPLAVIEALQDYYSRYNANVHRAVYSIGAEATNAYEQARKKTADFIKSPSSETIIFTRNATEAINLVAYTWAEKHLDAGDEIILTEMEHHSNIIPWHLLSKRKGLKIKTVPFHNDFQLDLKAFQDLLTSKTKLAALIHVSNVLGTINPIEEMIHAAHRSGARVLVDASQSAPHMNLDVKEMDCDFAVFSSHKMLGPTGIGVLYAKLDLLESMPPFLGGGEMISEVSMLESTYRDSPWKFEAGTPNISGAIAFGNALDYLSRIDFKDLHEHECHLRDHTMERLLLLGDVALYAPAKNYSGILSFNLKNIHPHDAVTFLDDEGVCVRAGQHCAQPLVRKLGVNATLRVSFYLYNTMDDIDPLVEGLMKAKEVFIHANR